VKHKSLLVALFAFSFSLGVFAQFSRVEIRPRSHNYGRVKVGEAKTKSFRLTSANNPFRIIEFSFLLNSSPDFIVLSIPEGQDIPAGRPVYFDVAFRPASPGVVQATLRITTRILDGTTSIVSLKLKGYGGSSAIQESAKNIVQYIQNSSAEGTLIGIGEGSSAQKHLKEFMKIFKDAFKSLEKGKAEDTCKKLLEALERMDSDSSSGNPEDLVQGEAIQKLGEMVQKLRQEINCTQ